MASLIKFRQNDMMKHQILTDPQKPTKRCMQKLVDSAHLCLDLGISKNGGTPKSSILLGFSMINHPFWGFSRFLETPIS